MNVLLLETLIYAEDPYPYFHCGIGRNLHFVILHYNQGPKAAFIK